MRILFLMDAPERLTVAKDTSLRLIQESLKRFDRVDYCFFREKLDTNQLKVQQVHECDPEKGPSNFISLGDVEHHPAQDYSIVFHRQDPPVDEDFIEKTKSFSKLSKKILQINNPDWTWKLREHTLPLDFPEYAIPTFICKDFEEFKKQITGAAGDTVAKPENSFGGTGIAFFSPKSSPESLELYWDKTSKPVIVQPYQEAITSIGDLRILVMNKNILGGLLRKPAPGSKIANLMQGGSGHAVDPSPKQIEACRRISEELNKKGLYFLGLDFIGDLISEINITCPTGLVNMNALYSTQLEKTLMNEVEDLWKQHNDA